jgi:hypothetical protein
MNASIQSGPLRYDKKIAAIKYLRQLKLKVLKYLGPGLQQLFHDTGRLPWGPS